jgi:hypothetical protein
MPAKDDAVATKESNDDAEREPEQNSRSFRTSFIIKKIRRDSLRPNAIKQTRTEEAN